MKIIDDEGRLFGKINIIDAFVLIFLFCIIPAFVIGYRIMRHPINPRITMLQSDYEKERSSYEQNLTEWQEKYNLGQSKLTYWQRKYDILNEQKDKLLKNHPKLNKYFR